MNWTLESWMPAAVAAWNIVGLLVFVFAPLAVLAELLRYGWLEFRKDRIPILLYHRLSSRAAAERGEIPDDEMIWVSYDTRFEEQMQFLRDAGYTTLDMDDYHEIRKGLRPLPDRPVAITFDDGYLSTYTLGYPVLKRLGLKATVFVLLEPDEHSRNLVKGIDDYLTPQQMQEMAANGISIQSHTVSHCILNELGDDDAWRELTESRQRISEITGRPVRHIAIPRSGYSRRIKKLAAKAGYLTACCNNKGSANGWSNLLALPRIVVERDMTLDDFEQCLSPNGGILLRTAGNLKRLPERLGGARFAYWLRGILYRDPWGRLFATKNLKKIVLGVAAAYLLCSAWFCWHLVAN